MDFENLRYHTEIEKKVQRLRFYRKTLDKVFYVKQIGEGTFLPFDNETLTFASGFVNVVIVKFHVVRIQLVVGLKIFKI